MTNEELIEEVKRYYSDNFEYLSSDQPTLSILTNVARHFAEWCAEHKQKDEQFPPLKGLDAIKAKYYDDGFKNGFDEGVTECREQMMKDGNVILTEEDFEAEKEKSMEWGYNLCKEQMMKEAVEGEIQMRYSGSLCAKTIRAINEDKFKLGDKVRIIIVKDEK